MSPQMTDPQLSRTNYRPIGTPRTMRFQEVRGLTSLPAGRMVPISAAVVHREDALRRGTIRLSFESMETAEILMNGMFVNVLAYFVSYLALDRFDGMDALNRSYQKKAVEGLPVVPFFETMTAPAPGINLIHKYLGMHYKTGESINTVYDEAYNQIWNFRAANRSPDLAKRTRLQNDLAPAFWRHQQFKNVVPDFDQAVIDGEVPLNVTSANLPIRGLGKANRNFGLTNQTVYETGKGATTTAYPFATDNGIIAKGSGASNANFEIFAELAAAGITVSLSNIEVARKTQAFARLKEQYKGLSDDYIIDLLMQGIRVPEQEFNQPYLLAQKSTVFGMSKRYSTDADAMTESVVNGATFVDLQLRLPQNNVGGVIMVVAEVLPEQLFERQRDPLMFTTDVATLPDYLRDTLDPEKVEVVLNGDIDAAHATPTGTFGYAPLNHKWMVQTPKIGGKFYRSNPADNTNDEVRQRIWAVETVNPSLAADFYISTNINTKPFVVQNADPFEVVSRGMLLFDGLTVFGGALVESTGSYDEIMAEVPMDRIPLPAGQQALSQEAIEATTEASKLADAKRTVAAAAAKAAAAKPGAKRSKTIVTAGKNPKPGA